MPAVGSTGLLPVKHDAAGRYQSRIEVPRRAPSTRAARDLTDVMWIAVPPQLLASAGALSNVDIRPGGPREPLPGKDSFQIHECEPT